MRLTTLGQPYVAGPPTAIQARPCRTLLRQLPERFGFGATPAVPPDNHAAERSLRHLVTACTISGGTRSAHGTAKLTRACLFGTAQLRGLDPRRACASRLTSGHL